MIPLFKQKKIVFSHIEPPDTNVLWLTTKKEDDTLFLLYTFDRGSWVVINGDIVSILLNYVLTLDILYTNETPVPVTIGGIEQDSTFKNKTIQEMFDLLLYPYLYPSFTSFSILGIPTTLEVCQSISPTKTYLWSTSNSDNINANTIEIWHGEFSNSGLSNDGSEVITDIIDISEFQIQEVPTVLNIPGTYNFQIQAQNSQNDSFSRIFTVTWKYKIFHGTSITDPTDSAAIRALANSLFDTNSFSININDLKYVIAVPDTKTLQEVRTSNFEDITPNFIQQDNIDVELADGVTTKSYKVYLLTTALPLDVTATVKLI